MDLLPQRDLFGSLAADCLYSLACYRTREFPRGARCRSPHSGGTSDLARCPRTLDVSPRLRRTGRGAGGLAVGLATTVPLKVVRTR
jgi:hypothetical protein